MASHILTTPSGKKICAGTYRKCYDYWFNNSRSQSRVLKVELYELVNGRAIRLFGAWRQ